MTPQEHAAALEAARRIVETWRIRAEDFVWIKDAGNVARALLALSEWKPIDSAPKDGTPIIIARYDRAFGWVRGWATWEADVGSWLPRRFFDVPGELGLSQPTHFLPLPSPPKENGNEG